MATFLIDDLQPEKIIHSDIIMKMHRLWKAVSLLTILATGILIWFGILSGKQNPAQSNKIKLTVTSPEIPGTLSFAGEETPLFRNDIYERLDNELISNTYFHSNTIKLLKRAKRWFPVIEPILRENNIPEDFKYLALAESGLQNVTSPSGAKGFWQFLKKTAQEYGLEVNKDIDERYHVEKATRAACQYLNDAFEKYHNWTLAAASYNAGMDYISDQLENQKVNNYYDLYLNPETSRYIFRILAIKTIFENPQKYGFYLNQSDLYQPLEYTTVKIDTTINNLVDFAKKHGMTYNRLKSLNPWLRSDKLPDASRKTYLLKIRK